MVEPLPDETADGIRNAVSAGHKLEAIRLYREATGVGLAEAKAFVDQLESEESEVKQAAMSRRALAPVRLTQTGASALRLIGKSGAVPSEAPAKSLLDFGWSCEPTAGGGVRLRRTAGWRGAALGCTFGILVLFSPLVVAAFSAGKDFWRGPADDDVLRIVFLLIPLVFVGMTGLIVTAILVQILRLAFLREEWEASRNMLVVRWRLLGFSRSREHRDGELVLEPHYLPDRHTPQWRLTVNHDGEKHFLFREPSVSVGGIGTSDSHAESVAVANGLASHTGWNVTTSAVSVEGQTQPPSASNEAELLIALRSRGFVADVDERLRLTIRLPKLGQWIGGLVLLAMGVGWLWIMAGAVNSFVNDAQVKQQTLLQFPFWLLMTPMLMVGVGLCALGVVAFFGRERWTVDRNLLLIRSRIFGWKSEHEFVDARWKLTRVRHTTSKGGTCWTWQLHLENQAGRTLKVLRKDRDDDIPRLLGTLLSQRTGWTIQETEA